MSWTRKKISLAVSAALAGTSASVANAQIEEIIVTATKRAESAQDVPISVQAVTGDGPAGRDLRPVRRVSAERGEHRQRPRQEGALHPRQRHRAIRRDGGGCPGVRTRRGAVRGRAAGLLRRPQRRPGAGRLERGHLPRRAYRLRLRHQRRLGSAGAAHVADAPGRGVVHRRAQYRRGCIRQVCARVQPRRLRSDHLDAERTPVAA